MAFGDVIYINGANTEATVFDLRGPLGHISFPVNVSTSARLSVTLATIGIGGRFIGNGSNSEGTAFVGVRYANINVSAGWTLTGPPGLFPRTGNARKQ